MATLFCSLGIKNNRVENRIDRERILKHVIEKGWEPCEGPEYYCRKYDSICSTNFSFFSDRPDEIAILAWDNVRPLDSVIDQPFRDFRFMDSFSHYFQFADSIPTHFFFKDKNTNIFLGELFPQFHNRFYVNVKNGVYEKFNDIFFFKEDLLIIANISQFLSVKDVYLGEWYLEGEKLYINVNGEKLLASAYFEAHGDIKKVKWNDFMLGRSRL